MYSYTYIPPRNIKKNSLFSLSGFAVGACFMYASSYLPYAFVLQIIGITFIALSIFMTTRYLIRKYVYCIQKITDGDYDFAVNEINGDKTKTVCRINADEITDFIYSKDGKVPLKYKGKNGRDILRFDYCPEPLPSDAYYLFAELREGKICIKLSPDKRLADTIQALLTNDKY